MKKAIFVALILVVILVFLEFSEARRGGGGRGARFGGRSRYRSRYRSRTSRISSGFRSKYSGYRLGSKSSIRNAILIGAVFGAARWRVRRPHFRTDDSYLPEVCYNDRYNQNEYGNVSYYGRFLCPDDYQENNRYCCGEEGRQYCCGFWDEGGRVAGVVIGILAGVIGIGVLVYCCCCRNRRKPQNKGTTLAPPKSTGYTEQAVPLKDNPGGYYSTTNPQPYPNTYPTDMTMPPPPNYNSAAMDGRLPYEVSPGVPNGGYPGYPATNPGYGGTVPQQMPPAYSDAYDKPPMPQSDVGNGTGLPYGLNPGSTPSTAPYPSAPGYPSGNPPYPSGNAPYPSGNAPYPNY